MPYIKPELRPMFNEIYIHATYLSTRPDLYTLESVKNELFNALGEVDAHKRTGCLNYFFTKILRDCLNNKTAPLLSAIMKSYFLTDLSYESLERANGFLYRLRKEFQRRKWNNPYNDVYYFIDLFSILVDVEAEDYEDLKIKENGDV